MINETYTLKYFVHRGWTWFVSKHSEK